MKKMMLATIALMFMILLVACGEANSADDDEQQDRSIPVETVEAEKGDLVVEKSIYARTAPSATTPVMVEQPSEIDSLEVTNGDRVEKDDLLATIATPSGRTNIYANQAGEIANLNVEEGSIATTEEPLAVIADLDTLKLEFTVTAKTRKLLTKDEKYPVQIAGEEYEAKIISIDTMPDDTGLYPVEATVENADEDILPGMVAVLKVPEKRVKDAILVPTETIVEEGDEAFVYVVEDNQAKKTDVTIGETQSDQTSIEGDIAEGDTVVVNGQLTLSDGEQVNIVKEGD
ncbi:MAG TPA: efflux RND transporter periplasmic adaptor subunit [Bacillota bacterium]|nr:efflux RND transporter periplasmic adaptor subunit [Bacillota bacterium]